jgi:hypothetical protein
MNDPLNPHSDPEGGLPYLVCEARARLGPSVTPEQVAEDIGSRGHPDVTVEAIRLVWDEGHLPTGV